MKRTILAVTATGLMALALMGAMGTPTRDSCTTGSCPPAEPGLAGPAAGASAGLATSALAPPTIGSVDLLDCVGFPVGFPVYLRSLLWAGWSIDPGSIVVDVPAPSYALA
jgi:hypothetical protein